MIVSHNWLQEYFEEKLPAPKELSTILNTRAFEVEGIEVVGEDTAIDIDVLPNRAHDCLSHKGIAKEIGVLTGLKMKQLAADSSQIVENSDKKYEVSIETPYCFRYMSRVIENVTVTESPDVFKQKLATLGQRSINSVVDATNIVMYELGQPLHAFDAAKLAGEHITIRTAEAGEQITTLDNNELALTGDEVVIADHEGVLALAGIKGGKKAEVDSETTTIVLEAANFHPAKVRAVSAATGISTDSSKRFERAITPELAEQALGRVTALLLEHQATASTAVGPVIDQYPRKAGVYKTGVSVDEVQKKLGISILGDDIEEVFQKLDFSFEKVSAKENFVSLAKSLEGVPYVFGASVLRDAPHGFDCSSFTAYCAKESGLSIPRMVIDQYVFSQEISQDELEPGDLIFANRHTVSDENQNKFDDNPEIAHLVKPEHDTSQQFMPGTKIEKAVDHVGIFVGEGRVIHCTGDSGVVIEDLDTAQPFHDVVSYRRIFEKEEERYVVTVPDERLDVRIAEDLIEEIGRIYGYDHIGEAPLAQSAEQQTNQLHGYLTTLRAQLAALGFSEIMTPSFAETGDIATVKAFASDKAFLRTNLSDAMQTALELNEKNKDLLGLDRIKLFEIGHVFQNKDAETVRIALGVSGKKPESVLTDVLDALGLTGDIREGVIEITLDEAAIPNYDNVSLPPSTTVSYKPFSQYPFVLRDIAVWVPHTITQDQVLEEIKENAGDLLVTHTLFDRYEKDDKVSYAFRLVFQSSEKTLTDEEINPIMDGITSLLNRKEGYEVR